VQDVVEKNYKVIVVDDGSDETLDLAGLDVVLIVHEKNQGKGEAILSGAKKAKELGYVFFVTMDADKQHLSSEIPKLVSAYKPDSIVIGNRDFRSENVPNSSKFGRAFSNFWVSVETFKKFGDTQSGFRIYPISILELSVKNRRFDFEIEVLVLHSYQGKKCIDVAVDCYYPPVEKRVSHFDKKRDNIRLSLLHSKLCMQRFIFLRGFLWK
jgi:glycosyltransferase involved in cell wall biosynthesis